MACSARTSMTRCPMSCAGQSTGISTACSPFSSDHEIFTRVGRCDAGGSALCTVVELSAVSSGGGLCGRAAADSAATKWMNASRCATSGSIASAETYAWNSAACFSCSASPSMRE